MHLLVLLSCSDGRSGRSRGIPVVVQVSSETVEDVVLGQSVGLIWCVRMIADSKNCHE
jgi:hypothetical protein